MRIFIAKININENIFKNNYKELIPFIGDAVLAKKNIKTIHSNSEWTFGETKEINNNGNRLISGKLYRLKENKKEKEWDEVEHKGKKIDKIFAFESKFLFDVNSELIVFQETDEISKEAFNLVFGNLCNMIDYRIGKLKLTLLTKTVEIESLLKEYNKVYYAKFNIIPANHNSNNGFSKLDDIIKEDQIEEITTTMKNEHGNIAITEGSIFAGFFKLVKSGYGTVKIIVGKKDSKKEGKKTINSQEYLHKKSIKEEEFEEKSIELLKEVKNLRNK